VILLEEMAKAGVHFGHRAARCNPRMKPFIYQQRNGIHIIDLLQTVVCLEETCEFLKKQSAQGKRILFVGTKRQAASLIKESAVRSKSFYVNKRWLGGMLTNWETMKPCINKLNKIEKQEEDGSFSQLPKKEVALLKKKKEKLLKFFGGVQTMQEIPDVVILIGQIQEKNAVQECKKLGITTITLLDTNCNPKDTNFIIPGNDDSIGSIELILNELTEAILQGKNSC
jgi:small subunit ribosomal protein S2